MAYIFVHHYTGEKHRDCPRYYTVRLPDDKVDELWERYVHAPVPDHYCGQLLKQEIDSKDIDRWHWKKFYKEQTGKDISSDRNVAISQFYRLVEREAIEFSDEYLDKLKRAKGSSTWKEKEQSLMAATTTKKKAPAKGKATKKAPAAKKKAPTKKAEASAGGTRSRLDGTKVIEVLVNENPKRPGTMAYDAFAKYKNGKTVEQNLANGVRPGDIRYDEKAGHIKLKKVA